MGAKLVETPECSPCHCEEWPMSAISSGRCHPAWQGIWSPPRGVFARVHYENMTLLLSLVICHMRSRCKIRFRINCTRAPRSGRVRFGGAWARMLSLEKRRAIRELEFKRGENFSYHALRKSRCRFGTFPDTCVSTQSMTIGTPVSGDPIYNGRPRRSSRCAKGKRALLLPPTIRGGQSPRHGGARK